MVVVGGAHTEDAIWVWCLGRCCWCRPHTWPLSGNPLGVHPCGGPSIGDPSMRGSIHWGPIHQGPIHWGPVHWGPSTGDPSIGDPWGIHPLGVHLGIQWGVHPSGINRGSIHLGFTHWDPLWGPSISVPSMADLQGDTFRTSWGVGVLYAPCSDPLVDHFGGPSLA